MLVASQTTLRLLFCSDHSVISPQDLAYLWREHATGLRLFARGYSQANAEDLLQEAFIRLARQRDLPRDPLAWLIRTLRNLGVDQVRSESRRRAREHNFAISRPAWFEPSDRDEIDQQTMQSALQQLDDLQRDVVVAHIWNGLSFRQIAESFSVATATAHRRYLEALQILREVLERPTILETNHES